MAEKKYLFQRSKHLMFFAQPSRQGQRGFVLSEGGTGTLGASLVEGRKLKVATVLLNPTANEGGASWGRGTYLAPNCFQSDGTCFGETEFFDHIIVSLCRVLVFLFCTWPPSPPLPPPPSHNSFTHSHTHTRTHTHTTLSYSLTYNIVTQHCLTPKLSHNFVTHTHNSVTCSWRVAGVAFRAVGLA